MLAAARARRLLQHAALVTDDIRDADWETSWKQHYTPTHIAPGLYIAPSWERAFAPPRGGNVIWLDPGMAFGTGKHATTQLALNLMLDYVRPRSIVLDIGCGSGILALAAAQRGARVYANDMDALAIAASRANFRANKLTPARIQRTSGVPARFPKADVIVANLTAAAIAPLAKAFWRKLKPGGILVTSGLIKGAAGRVRRQLERCGFEHRETGGRAQLGSVDNRLAVTGLWRAFVHQKPRSR
jgi:ribosomal protein L11 methyltransferase